MLNYKLKILLIVSFFYCSYILIYLAKFNYNPSATLAFADKIVTPYLNTLPSNLIIQTNSVGHDGQYYYALAKNFLQPPLPTPPHFRQRILYPLISKLSSVGNDNFIPLSMLIINFLSIIIGVFFFMRILDHYHANLSLTWHWAFNVSFLLCVLHNLTEPLMLCFITLGIYSLNKNRNFLTIIFFALATLTRETSLLIVFPIVIFYLSRKNYKESFLLSIPLIIFMMWQYVLLKLTGYSALLSSLETLQGALLQNISYYFSWNDLNQGIRGLYAKYSGSTVICFAIIQSIILWKDRKASLIKSILIIQIIFTFIYGLQNISIMDLGRNAAGMFLFSILYFAEDNKPYNTFLALLMILMSGLVFLERIVLAKIGYFIT